ncbi:MAG: energy-coupling factor transporter transmembrane protein EcfT, partial [Solobacterium sp.]|nr:energy-coupling factor transporter transmembrane protein EcfT [Solobacterium sp.]
KLSFTYIWKSMKPMLFMLVFLLIINVLVVHTGTVWLELGPIKVYSDAVIQTLYIVVRLL